MNNTRKMPTGYRYEKIQDEEGKAINVLRNFKQRCLDQLFDLELIDSNHFLAAEKFLADYYNSGFYQKSSIGLDYNDKGSSAFWNSQDESQAEQRYKAALRGLPVSLRQLISNLVLADKLPPELGLALDKRLLNIQKHDICVAIRAGLNNLAKFYGVQ